MSPESIGRKNYDYIFNKVTETSKISPLISISWEAVDLMLPGAIPVNVPLENISRKFRHDSRLLRIRGGYLAHTYIAADSFLNQNYGFMFAHLTILAVMTLLVSGAGGSFQLRRLKRISPI